ncbi:MAG TPA: hypothetical protein DD638_01060 [Pasteurellaceae bacterium]|nr:hypothetical protein [Pasteurellaceae bacterium]
MKKSLLLGLALLALNVSAVEKTEVLRDHLIGEWSCKITYPDMRLDSLDVIEFQQDGTSVGIGYLFFTDMLAYETKHTGKWTFNNNILSESSTDYVTVKVHSDATMRRINEDPQFREFEEQFYQELSSENNSGASIDFEISHIQGNNMAFKQILGNRKYPGLCKRTVRQNS